MKRKPLILILAAVLTAVLLTVTAFATNKNCAMTLTVGSAEAELTAGALVEIPVTATDSTGYISGYVTVGWDPDALTLDSVTFTDLGPDDGSPAIDAIDRASGSYRLHIGNTSAPEDGGNIEGTGVLFTLHFTVAENASAGTYPVRITDELFLDFDLDADDIAVTVTDGAVTLTEALPASPDEPVTPDLPATTDEPFEDLFGDVNLSGKVDILDATAIQRHLAGIELLSERQLAVADTNRSSKVDILDATLIQRYLAGLQKEL